ncbi:MAG: hypothetical protein DLM53_04965 [Candidatus Eremiobacter antarcticus]|nr:diguanylate cyclase [Candidatus Eremiobacteraeota bacterium]PZR62764.1 MAG: hypothetical protein DLM53_04965 [Candidatus Eremiobacter sp. RRmetagenome_bin22]
MDEIKPGQPASQTPAAEQLEAVARVAHVFTAESGQKAIAALHEMLFERSVRRFTVATLDRDLASPVRYHYHVDLSAAVADPLDPQTLALALGAEQQRELPSVTPIRRLDKTGMVISRGRLSHAIVSPLRVGGAIIGFSLAQADVAFSPADAAVLQFASVLLAQDLEITRESAVGAHAARSLNMLLETARALSSGLDLSELFAKFHTLVGGVMDASLFVAALLTADGENLEIEYSAEFGRRSVERVRLPLTTVSGDVLRSGSPVIIRRPEDWRTVRSVTLGEESDPASALIVPMKVGDRVVGVLSVQSPRANSYTESDCDLLTAISEQASVAVENLKNLRASIQRAADLNLLVEVAGAVSSELDLHRVFAKIHDQVKRVIDAPLFFVALTAGDNSMTFEYMIEGDKTYPPSEHSMEGTIVGRVIESGKPVLVRNAEERDSMSRTRIGEGPTTVQSIVAVPMHVPGQTIGAISVQSYEANAYDERHLKLLRAIAEQSAVAVQNAKLYERAKELADNDALTGLPHQRSLQERLAYELKRARRTGSPLSLLMMDVDKFKTFNDTYGHPCGDLVLKEVAAVLRRVARATDVIGRYGGDEFCAILPDTDGHAALRFSERLEGEIGLRPFEIDKAQLVPIRLSIGAAVYSNHSDGNDDLIGIADAALYAAKRGETEYRGTADDMLSMLEGDVAAFRPFIAALANTGRVKREQLIKVNRLAGVYARLAGLDDAQRHLLQCAGAVLNLGELSIPAGILSKPAQLSAEEYERVKQHPQLGYGMLNGVPGGDAVAQTVLHHQERFDGSGYPRGLAGADIPLPARILGVLEAYAAMRSARPQRRALTDGEARAELHAGAGTQFDPEVVVTFLKSEPAQTE